jgi:hypothetical protein
MSDSMIERIARAIAAVETGSEINFTSFVQTAHAVLKAMKDPTPEMIQAVPPQTYRIEHYHGTGHHRDFPLLSSGHEQVWRALISKATEG